MVGCFVKDLFNFCRVVFKSLFMFICPYVIGERFG